ncbi:unnamed protein product [Camellia sinensis]
MRTKGHFARSKGAQLRKHIDATLGSGNLREAVRLPPGEDANEWLAVNTVDFFNQVNLLYGTLTEFCTPENCPTMTAGPKYEYRWADGVQIKKPIEVSAPKYVEYIENRERKMEEKIDVDGGNNRVDDSPSPTPRERDIKHLWVYELVCGLCGGWVWKSLVFVGSHCKGREELNYGRRV